MRSGLAHAEAAVRAEQQRTSLEVHEVARLREQFARMRCDHDLLQQRLERPLSSSSLRRQAAVASPGREALLCKQRARSQQRRAERDLLEPDRFAELREEVHILTESRDQLVQCLKYKHNSTNQVKMQLKYAEEQRDQAELREREVVAELQECARAHEPIFMSEAEHNKMLQSFLGVLENRLQEASEDRDAALTEVKSMRQSAGLRQCWAAPAAGHQSPSSSRNSLPHELVCNTNSLEVRTSCGRLDRHVSSFTRLEPCPSGIRSTDLTWNLSDLQQQLEGYEAEHDVMAARIAASEAERAELVQCLADERHRIEQLSSERVPQSVQPTELSELHGECRQLSERLESECHVANSLREELKVPQAPHSPASKLLAWAHIATTNQLLAQEIKEREVALHEVAQQMMPLPDTPRRVLNCHSENSAMGARRVPWHVEEILLEMHTQLAVGEEEHEHLRQALKMERRRVRWLQLQLGMPSNVKVQEAMEREERGCNRNLCEEFRNLCEDQEEGDFFAFSSSSRLASTPWTPLCCSPREEGCEAVAVDPHPPSSSQVCCLAEG